MPHHVPPRATAQFRQPQPRTRLPRPARGGRHRLLLSPSPGGAGPGAAQVLVVDDESAIRTICRVNLEAAGMQVVEASDGEAALTAAQKLRPSVVLLDVMMPGIDGWHVAQQLSARAETRDIPVVFLSARADPADLRQAHDVGAVGYIVKPFDPLELGDRLNEILDRIRRGEREHLRRSLAEDA